MSATTRTCLLGLALSAGVMGCPGKVSDEDSGPGDGFDAPQADDSDGDGIIDVNEGEGDQDDDGVPNTLDTDSDGDCISDRIERGDLGVQGAAPVNTDGDALPDFLDLDSDDNGLADHSEAGDCELPQDADRDGQADYADLDNDADTITDEAEGFGDTDSDGTPSAWDTDSDGDCLADSLEAGDADPATAPRDSDHDGAADFLDDDSDNDGLLDSDEVAGACEPAPDTDGDGTPDHLDEDIDGDGLDNADEATAGSDPLDRDSDDDGATDGLEVYAGTNPKEEASLPPGTILVTGPRQITELPGAYVVDATRVDIFLLLDTSYSYSCYHPNLPSFAVDLVNAVFTRFTNVAVGLGYYDDYTFKSGWAAPGGVPYRLAHQLSTDATAVKGAAASQNMVYGGDSYGSAYEALSQAVHGRGFDEDADGVKDTTSDVLPFLASSADAFGGAVPGSYNAAIPGTGSHPGVGWRAESVRIALLSADNTIRDAALGHEVPTGSRFYPASFASTTAAMLASDVKLVAMNVYEYQGCDATLQMQLENLAAATDSFYDEDGDGVNDDLAVFYGSWNWPDINRVVEAIWDLAQGATVDLWIELGDDPEGWISALEPTEVQEGLEQGDTIDYTIEVTTSAPTLPEDQFYHATLRVMANDGEYAVQDIWVVIRPEFVI